MFTASSLYAKTLQGLHLTVGQSSINRGTNTTIQATATYDDNITKDVTDQVEWIIDQPEALTIHGHTLTAQKETKVAIRARMNGKFSNNTKLTIYWEVNGHRLPPEPDPTVNNATLKGVDSNNNGVRDDVERKIYEKFSKPIERVMAMDEARFNQKTLVEPATKAKEIVMFSTKIGNCSIYLKHIGLRAKKWRENDKYIDNITFNNPQRVRKYLDYNLALSGGVYGSSPSDWNKDACSQEVKNVLKEMGL
jgi:hypothetical protein